MNTFLSLVTIITVFGGLLYFGYKSTAMGVHWVYMLLGVFFWYGAFVGIYWALNDLHLYYLGRPLIPSKLDSSKNSAAKEEKYSLKE